MIRMLLSSETGDRLVDMELSVEWTSMRKPSRCRQGRSRRAFAIPTRGMNWPTSSCVPTSADIRKVMAKPTTCQATTSFSRRPSKRSRARTNSNIVFHELTHWTRPQIKSRLGSRFAGPFWLHDYATEELVAELGAAFLCGEFGFDGDVRSARHIATWIELLNADKRAFFTACNEASKAAGYWRGLALANSPKIAA